MTDQQFEKCLQCLNRKKGITSKAEICNIKGKNLDFEGECTTFEQDSSVVVGKENKIKAIRPNEQRARNAQILIGMVLFFEIVSMVSSYLQLDLLKSLELGVYVTDDVLEQNDSREQIVALLYLIVFIISVVTFIQWFRRAYYNLNIRTSANHSEGWAAGSWFVPILSLFRPYQIMKEMWTKTDSLIKWEKPEYIKTSPGIIGIWWALWILSGYIGNYALKRAFRGDTIDDFIDATWADMAVSALGIPLAIVTWMMIKMYSNKEALLSELEITKINFK